MKMHRILSVQDPVLPCTLLPEERHKWTRMKLSPSRHRSWLDTQLPGGGLSSFRPRRNETQITAFRPGSHFSRACSSVGHSSPVFRVRLLSVTSQQNFALQAMAGGGLPCSPYRRAARRGPQSPSGARSPSGEEGAPFTRGGV